MDFDAEPLCEPRHETISKHFELNLAWSVAPTKWGIRFNLSSDSKSSVNKGTLDVQSAIICDILLAFVINSIFHKAVHPVTVDIKCEIRIRSLDFFFYKEWLWYITTEHSIFLQVIELE